MYCIIETGWHTFIIASKIIQLHSLCLNRLGSSIPSEQSTGIGMTLTEIVWYMNP